MTVCSCALPCECVAANIVADTIGAAPEYLQQDAARWNSAAHVYEDLHHQETSRVEAQMFQSRCRSQHHSPERHVHGIHLNQNKLSSQQKIMGGSLYEIALDAVSVPMSLHKVSSINRSAGTNPASRGGESSLELEAIAAVHELSFAVQSISVSEMLPRTPDLIFVNVTTIEGQPYCLELTLKGWRITSLRTDCMVGDFTKLELFTKYYDSLYALMDEISPGYRARFGEKLTLRLRLLQTDEDDHLGSLQSPPLSRTSTHSSASRYSSNDSLPIVTPVSTPAVDPGFDKPLF